MIAIRTLLTLTLLLGVAYPLAVTGLAQLIFPWQANGSLLTNDKQQVIGSALLAQKFERADYFHSRPSASDFATIGGSASNLGMSSPLRAEFAAAAARAQPEARVPALLTRSASGLDPHLPLDAVLAQVDRVAGQRGLDPVRLTEQVKSAAQAGILGPQVVNILQLNLQLDKDKNA
ncbi:MULTISPECIES: potassium-transporting ATPase subunit C [Aeromonas]|uniref:Potassium-transporting ATPase KdpC subunit n=1 Tax=Aeromonas caviae TaxID=648 RepID=A0AAV4YKC0_AERCA|nr:MULTISPECIES: potassium-transporting ATPase subunit C [Aeromonas]BDN90471.1 potassium-transporting ATPase KdpC subunit [Aeromonas caviae]GJA31291.1 potassium-transporting ATPase KdpC subunit [Aeromonas caviae]GJA35631.1 potassium-transporting ATPase KdpC subunit [Aeromonas caviae]GJA40348.1 potassium-transporting ATPase KdpC subunit [Aeromonas caviae]GJA75959.1 potassium-transporting ATPase KdpC subunit [Aeromonas caviae]